LLEEVAEDVCRVSGRVVDLLQVEGAWGQVPDALAPWLTVYEPLVSERDDTERFLRALHPQLPKQLRKLFRRQPCRFLLTGPSGAGARTFARWFAGVSSAGVGEVEAKALLRHGERLWGPLLRECALRRLVLLVRDAAALGAESADPTARAMLLHALARSPLPCFLDGGPSPSTSLALALVERLDVALLPLNLPDSDTRAQLWPWILAQAQPLGAKDAPPREKLEGLADHVRAIPLGTDQMFEAAQVARARGESLDGRAWPPQPKPLKEACLTLLSHRLGELASRVDVQQSWDDLVLTDEAMRSVQELLAFGRLSKLVLNDWGYGARIAYGKGLTALFSGPSGTGKTLVAGLIAKALGKDLYRIDLSKLVSKYIGETEERLAVLFEEAKASDAALLFDEADSMFGKRTEVKSSTDRYANLEVNFLLQQLESHPGVVLLTSNFPKSIDEAFLRRLRFRVHFPTPGVEERERLWRNMIPKEAPQDVDLDLKRLSAAFELSGGEIRNAVMRAALRAAAQDRPLSAEDLRRAARAEYRQLGRLMASHNDD
jgi:ABC-type dipeptide/oligopeptide/nickel transport system ATPase subunit